MRQLVLCSQTARVSKSAACLALIIGLEVVNTKKKRKKRAWVKDWYRKQAEFTHENLLQELLLSSPEDYENYLRMNHSTFLDLLQRVEPLIKKKKQDTNMRDSIPFIMIYLCLE